jgi:hypothetical protein
VKSGEEPRLAHNRVLLSSVLAGEVRVSDISLKPAAWRNAEVAAHAGIAVNRGTARQNMFLNIFFIHHNSTAAAERRREEECLQCYARPRMS